jgi:hypothetical protein
MEMTLRARQITATLYNMSSYMVAAFFYLLVTIPLGRLVANLEARLAASESGGAANRPEPLVPNPTDTDPATPISTPGGYYR